MGKIKALTFNLSSSGERERLLSRLADLLISSSPQTGVHFEMASFVDEGLMKDLLQLVIPHVCRNELIPNISPG